MQIFYAIFLFLKSSGVATALPPKRRTFQIPTSMDKMDRMDRIRLRGTCVHFVYFVPVPGIRDSGYGPLRGQAHLEASQVRGLTV